MATRTQSKKHSFEANFYPGDNVWVVETRDKEYRVPFVRFVVLVSGGPDGMLRGKFDSIAEVEGELVIT